MKPHDQFLGRRFAFATLSTMVVAGATFLGCSSEAQRAAPVNPARAREALHTVLESWKGGDKMDGLKTASPPIVVQDFDWLTGSRLLKYEVTGDGKDDDANLRIPVTLTLKTSQGQQVQKSVSYVVGTSPTLTVFREFN